MKSRVAPLRTRNMVASSSPLIACQTLTLFSSCPTARSHSSLPPPRIRSGSKHSQQSSPLSSLQPADGEAMWRKNLGQNFNYAGMSSSFSVVLRDHHLALPHISVRDVRSIDWRDLKRRGIKGVVFDKDNTLTVPYSDSLWPLLCDAIEDCKTVFPGKVAVLSNSAGLRQYDPDGLKAKVLEQAIGISVIRHGTKKPGGSAEDIEKYFGYDASALVMVGDRVFTDIVYGNRNGFLTILTEPLKLSEEPPVVRQVRRLETYLLDLWQNKGLRPNEHFLLSDKNQYAKNLD